MKTLFVDNFGMISSKTEVLKLNETYDQSVLQRNTKPVVIVIDRKQFYKNIESNM